MITIENRQVYSSTGLYIHRKGSDVYFHRCTMLPNETEADFEEVENVPTGELAEAITAKIAEIEAYDTSSAVNQFFLNGVPMWYPATKRATIKNLVNSSVMEGRETTTLWTEEEPIVPITISCDAALQLLAKLEVYAGDALANTQKHKAAVLALTSVEDVQAYNYTTGYPEKLQLKY